MRLLLLMSACLLAHARNYIAADVSKPEQDMHQSRKSGCVLPLLDVLVKTCAVVQAKENAQLKADHDRRKGMLANTQQLPILPPVSAWIHLFCSPNALRAPPGVLQERGLLLIDLHNGAHQLPVAAC